MHLKLKVLCEDVYLKNPKIIIIAQYPNAISVQELCCHFWMVQCIFLASKDILKQ